MRIKRTVAAIGLAFSVGAGASRAQQLPGGSEAPASWKWLGDLAPRGQPLPAVPVAVPAGSEVWTMDKALARALNANPDVQVTLAGVQRQDGVRLQTMSLLLPRVAASASLDHRDAGLLDRAPNSSPFPSVKDTAIAQYAFDARIEVRQTVFDGLAGWHQVKRAALLQKKAALDARDAYLRVASQVRQGYDAIVLRQTVIGVRRDAVRDLGHLAEVAQKRFETGAISEFESLRAQSALRSAEADLAQAEADLTKTEEFFCRLLFITKPQDGVRVAGKTAPLDYTETFETALRRARADRLDVRAAALDFDAAKLAQQSVAASSLLPKIDAYTSYGKRTSYFDFEKELKGWTFGVMGSWSLFDSGQTIGLLRVQRADRRIAEIRLAEAQHAVGSQVHELFASLEQTRTVMAAQANARDLGERSLREARKLYEVGRVSLEEVLNSEMAYRQGLLGWLIAVFTYNTTIYQLDYATANEAFLDGVVQAKKP